MLGNFDAGAFLGAGIIGLVLMLIFWAIIIWAIVAFIRWISRRGKDVDSTKKDKQDDMQDILNERYAKGEISKEEYEVRKKDLVEQKMSRPEQDRRDNKDRRS